MSFIHIPQSNPPKRSLYKLPEDTSKQWKQTKLAFPKGDELQIQEPIKKGQGRKKDTQKNQEALSKDVKEGDSNPEDMKQDTITRDIMLGQNEVNPIRISRGPQRKDVKIQLKQEDTNTGSSSQDLKRHSMKTTPTLSQDGLEIVQTSQRTASVEEITLSQFQTVRVKKAKYEDYVNENNDNLGRDKQLLLTPTISQSQQVEEYNTQYLENFPIQHPFADYRSDPGIHCIDYIESVAYFIPQTMDYVDHNESDIPVGNVLAQPTKQIMTTPSTSKVHREKHRD